MVAAANANRWADMKTIIILYVLGWFLLFVLRWCLARILSEEEKAAMNVLITKVIRDPLNVCPTKRTPDVKPRRAVKSKTRKASRR